jgi:hypothetical protein
VAEEDVLIAWNHGAIPPAVKPAFTRPTRFINLPNPEPGQNWSSIVSAFGPSPIRGILAKYAAGVTPLRVGLLGFSASCAGVSAVLGSNDGGNIDVVYACDGIHVGYGANKVLNEAGLQPWLNYGARAAVNACLFVITHSSVVPPTYASTTETANWLWTKLTSNSDPNAADPAVPNFNVSPTNVHVNAPPATKPYDVAYPQPPWKRRNRRDGLIVLGCDNLDIPAGYADHIYQAKAIMPAVLAQVIAQRWNAIDPKAPGQSCFIGGPPTHPGDFFTLGAAQCASSVVLPNDYMSTQTSSPLPSASIAPAAKFTTAKQIGVGTVVAVGALGLGALWWLAQSAPALAANPRRAAGMSPEDFDPEELERGTEHEMEHTDSRAVAERIAMDHLAEDPDYYEKLEAVLPNPARVLPYTVRFDGDTATIRYKSADDSKRVFELRVKAYSGQGGSWDLYDPEGRLVSRGTLGDFGSLNYARGPALPQTIDKAERVLRSTGIWGYTGRNKERWGVDQPS